MSQGPKRSHGEIFIIVFIIFIVVSVHGTLEVCTWANVPESFCQEHMLLSTPTRQTPIGNQSGVTATKMLRDSWMAWGNWETAVMGMPRGRPEAQGCSEGKGPWCRYCSFLTGQLSPSALFFSYTLGLCPCRHWHIMFTQWFLILIAGLKLESWGRKPFIKYYLLDVSCDSLEIKGKSVWACAKGTEGGAGDVIVSIGLGELGLLNVFAP